MPLLKEANVIKKLPPKAGTAIDQYYNRIGQNYIYGFDVFKDSSMKI